MQLQGLRLGIEPATLDPGILYLIQNLTTQEEFETSFMQVRVDGITRLLFAAEVFYQM